MNTWIYKVDNLTYTNEECLLHETIFHNANGYIGIRGNLEEGVKEEYDTIRGTYINGFYDISPMKQAEKLYGFVEEKQTILNVIDTQTIELKIDGEKFSLFDGNIQKSCRYLDMKSGFTVHEIHWCSNLGKEIKLTIKRMTSFEQKSLFFIQYSVESVNFTGEIELISWHKGEVSNYYNKFDPRVASEKNDYLIPVKAEVIDDISLLVTKTKKSNLNVCTIVKNKLSKDGQHKIEIEGHNVKHCMKAMIKEGEEIHLDKYTIFTDSIREKQYEEVAQRELKCALKKSVTQLFQEQKKYLDCFWNSSLLEIEGDEELAIAIKYNLYQLIQSVGKDRYSNIAAKGLSGEGYEGHYFWDTEMYIQPFFLLTNPEISKQLIEYRYNILNEARENAKILGQKKGAAFAWRTIMGKECSGYFPAGSAQYHISGDIAYSVIMYYLMTKDLEFIAKKGAEIVFETARTWIEIGNFHEDKFMINEVTGPDEYTCLVNNNYYTNVNAQFNLHWAVKFYFMLKEEGKLNPIMDKIDLKEEEIFVFERAEKQMYLPYDETYGINPQDDSFLQKKVWDMQTIPKDKFPILLHYHPMHIYRYQICKQADTVLAHFLFEDAQSIDVMRRSFEYYEKVTTHDSSLSTCIFSIMASKLGFAEKAYDYFGDSAKLDLFNLHKNTKDGIHTANMGGNYMAVVYGFAGLRIKDTGIYFSPTIPKKWKKYEFKIVYEGTHIRVTIQKDRCSFKLEQGEMKKIYIYDQIYELADELEVELKNRV